MSRIAGPLFTYSLLYLYFYHCTGTYGQFFIPKSCQKPHWFKCHDGQCIPYTFECDGEPDCIDESDEKNCVGFKFHNPAVPCAENEYKCENNDCIPLDKFCDSTNDCIDGSDEQPNCTDKLTCEGMFRCRNRYCVKEAWHCDGLEDCSDGSDEINCDNATISASECKLENDLYLCPNQRCISLLKTCDGKDDCGDRRDESGSCSNGTALCQSANCDHNCRKTPQGAVCVCRHGYKLMNNHTCTDIDECETYGICDHYCVNTAGSYNCYCDKNYALQKDGKTCKATGGEATLIFSTRTEIRAVHLDSQIYFPVVQNLNNSLSVAIDGDYIYWSQSVTADGNQMIVKICMGWEGTQENIVKIGLHTVSGLAIDWITGNIYFVDDTHIGVCSNNENSHQRLCTILIKEENSNPKGLALLPNTGTMYWCDWSAKPFIAQAGMDGQNMSLLVADNLGWPNSVSIDYWNGRLYWVDTKLKLVESIRLDGTDRRAILQDVVKHPLSIAIFENKLYWSDWDTIQSCDKFSGKNWKTLLRTNGAALSIHIDHSAIKPKFKNPCESNPCSELCLLKQNYGYTCACTMDKKLNINNHTCQDAEIDHVAIIAGKMILDYYRELIGIPKMHFFSQAFHITAVAYDSLTGTLLLNDQLSNCIFGYDLAETESNFYRFIELDVEDVVTGMAYDYIGDNLYISFKINKMIQVVNLKTFNKTVFNFPEQPYDILLIPEEGMMFVVFGDQNNYYIDRLRMDATNPDEPLARAQFKKETIHKGPKISLCYDNVGKVVFFAHQAIGYIKAFSIKDSKVQFHYSGIRELTNLVYAGGYLYWSESKSSILYSLHKYNLLNENYIDLNDLNVNEDISHLVAIRNVSVHGEYGCRNNNGNCSYLCLTTSATSFVCACPLGMMLAVDNHTCVSLPKCPANKIQCKDYNICIDPSKWCNGIKDCPLNDDEPINCKASGSCGKEQFMCKDGSCIDMAKRCNWHFDCTDQSDEKDCSKWRKCASDEFKCASGDCIDAILACNGKFDCDDLSDEIDCKHHTCTSNEFMCKKKRQCIPLNWQCDGQIDCEDESDEQECKQDTCGDENFICKNNLCISWSMQCNGIDDCGDNSDEENCWNGRKSHFDNCTDDEYPCANTDICLPKHLRCNGVQDCPKNDDEHHCASCLTNEFLCKNQRCIQHMWMCDGLDDCGDNSDEEDCNKHYGVQMNINFNMSAKCDEFQCSSTGMCLPYSKVCDVKQDCSDGSDERGECSVACVRDNDCEELCFKTPQGGVCGCNEGFRLAADKKSCIDINECEDVICSQLCENTLGSYKCSCFTGYMIRSDGISCKANGPLMDIFTAVDNNIKKISLHLLHSISIVNVSSNMEITGIDVDALNNVVYWSNGELGTINKINLKMQNISTLVDASYPTKLSVDWITNNVYFIDKFYPNAIRVCNLELMKCAIVIQRQSKIVTSLLVDPLHRWLYWSETDRKMYKNSQIFRAYMKGTEIKVIISENVGNVVGMAIDYITTRLYWVDFVNKVVESSNLDGTERHQFLKTNENPLNIGIFENSLYLVTETRNQIQKCLLYGKHSCETFNIGRNNIYKHFALMQISRYPYVENFCKKQICDHMCILDVNGAACICADGKLVGPNEICITEDENEDRIMFASNINVKSRNTLHRSGNYSTLIVTLLFTLLILFGIGYCYYQKTKFRPGLANSEFVSFSSIRFQNPSYDRADEVAVMLDRSNISLAPGEHEYANPIDDEVMKAAEECSIEKLRQIPQTTETEEKDTLISFTWQK